MNIGARSRVFFEVLIGSLGASALEDDWRGEACQGIFANALIEAPHRGGAFAHFLNCENVTRGLWKWTQYFPAYQRHLSQWIGLEVHILEIGVNNGGSLAMWKHVFGGAAHIYGVDIDQRTRRFEDDQTKIFIADQGDLSFWRRFVDRVPHLDIVIDDGSHIAEQQIQTLKILYQHLSPNGVYIVEDIVSSRNRLWTYVGAVWEEPVFIEKVASVHFYPYLFVLEAETGTRAFSRQFGTDSVEQIAFAYEPDSKEAITALQQKILERIHVSNHFKTNTSSIISKWRACRRHWHQCHRDLMLVVGFGKPITGRTFLKWNDWSGRALRKGMALLAGLHTQLSSDLSPTKWSLQKHVESWHLFPNFVAVKMAGVDVTPVLPIVRGTRWPLDFRQTLTRRLESRLEKVSLSWIRRLCVQVDASKITFNDVQQ